MVMLVRQLFFRKTVMSSELQSQDNEGIEVKVINFRKPKKAAKIVKSMSPELTALEERVFECVELHSGVAKCLKLQADH